MAIYGKLAVSVLIRLLTEGAEILLSMHDTQLDLFKKKKFDIIQTQQVSLVKPTGKSTVMGTLLSYNAYLKSGGYSKYTPDDFTGDIKKLSLFLRDKKVGDITLQDIQSFIANLKSPKGEHLSEKTVSRKVSALNNYFSWLLLEEAIVQSPMEHIYNKRITSPLPDILFESDCKKLLAAASSDSRTYLIFLLLLETGIKKEELMDVTVQNFDFSDSYNPEVWIKHSGKKRKKDRKLKLPKEIVDVFNDYVSSYAISEILFPITDRMVRYLITQTAERADIKKAVSAQILRDTFAVIRLKRGEDIEQVLTKLGLSPATWEDAKEKYLKLSSRGI